MREGNTSDDDSHTFLNEILRSQCLAYGVSSKVLLTWEVHSDCPLSESVGSEKEEVKESMNTECVMGKGVIQLTREQECRTHSSALAPLPYCHFPERIQKDSGKNLAIL